MEPNPPSSCPPSSPSCVPSSTTQVLGKRKYDSTPIMRVSNQFRNTGGSSSHVLGPRFSAARQFREPLSVDSMNSRYQGEQPVLSEPASGSRANNPAGRPIFFHNTVLSIQNGRRPRVDRNTTQHLIFDTDGSSVERARLLVKPPRPKRQVFHASRPLRNSEHVYTDVWVHVLSFCEPKLLIEAKALNSHFYRLLSDNSIIWKKSRINHYGADMPDCPEGLTEKQYVELLAGRGCQSKDCPVDRTYKVHWMFQVRLCPDCFKQRTMHESDLAPHRRLFLPQTRDRLPPGDGRPLWELLPLARTDGRRDANSRHVDTEANDWVADRGRFAFLKSSFAEIEAQYLHLSASDQAISALLAWASKIHGETIKFMAEVNKLESWSKEHTKTVQASKAQAWRQRRIDYFEARAAELSPPMDRRILWRMAAFTRILKVQSEATDRSWDALRTKIEPYRSHAKQVEEFERLMASDFIEAVPQVRLFRRLHEHRCGREAIQRSYQPEQKFVLQLAEAEFVRCVNDKVADEDLLLLCLKNVFDAYDVLENPPVGLNVDGTTGPYRLSLDDARMIVEDVLEERIPAHSERGRIVFQSLKCRGCRRADHIRTWSFADAFEHMLQTHAKQVGEGLEYYQFATPYPSRDLSGLSPEEGGFVFKFPWYTVLWPRNLPLVPRHQDVSQLDAWQPDVSTEFIPLSGPLRVSAFHGRRPLQEKYAEDDFGLNLVYAAKKLNGVWLDGPCQMKIALKYALDLYAQKHTREPPLSTFMACLDELVTANSAIQLRFRCGICVVEDKGPRTVRKFKHTTALDVLQNHWADRHHDATVGWSQGLMHLPSEDEVLQQIVHADKKLQNQKDALAERAIVLSTNIRKRAKLKGSVVLQVRPAAEVFDELFPREVVKSERLQTL